MKASQIAKQSALEGLSVLLASPTESRIKITHKSSSIKIAGNVEHFFDMIAARFCKYGNQVESAKNLIQVRLHSEVELILGKLSRSDRQVLDKFIDNIKQTKIDNAGMLENKISAGIAKLENDGFNELAEALKFLQRIDNLKNPTLGQFIRDALSTNPTKSQDEAIKIGLSKYMRSAHGLSKKTAQEAAEKIQRILKNYPGSFKQAFDIAQLAGQLARTGNSESASSIKNQEAAAALMLKHPVAIHRDTVKKMQNSVPPEMTIATAPGCINEHEMQLTDASVAKILEECISRGIENHENDEPSPVGGSRGLDNRAMVDWGRSAWTFEEYTSKSNSMSHATKTLVGVTSAVVANEFKLFTNTLNPRAQRMLSSALTQSTPGSVYVRIKEENLTADNCAVMLDSTIDDTDSALEESAREVGTPPDMMVIDEHGGLMVAAENSKNKPENQYTHYHLKRREDGNIEVNIVSMQRAYRLHNSSMEQSGGGKIKPDFSINRGPGWNGPLTEKNAGTITRVKFAVDVEQLNKGTWALAAPAEGSQTLRIQTPEIPHARP